MNPMPELFQVVPPAEAARRILERLQPHPNAEEVPTAAALGRVTASAIIAPHDLPGFPRSAVDGFAVRAKDTYGATEGLPALLARAGEVPMGAAPQRAVETGQAVLVHTGGFLPPTADAVVMVEYTHGVDGASLEVARSVAIGENVIQVGEDIRAGEPVLDAGHRLRPQDLGALAGIGVTRLQVARRPRVAILSTGDEVVPPDHAPALGQIRDINSYSLGALCREVGGEPLPAGIVPDDYDQILVAARAALARADLLVISAGSSVSVRDLTARVIDALGSPGVLVHGISIKPGKPTIVGFCDGKAVFGLPGNPVSAMVLFDLVITPVIERLLGCTTALRHPVVAARLTRNLASLPGREDWVQVRLLERDGTRWAEPIFGKSSLIFTMVRADGMIQIPLDESGLEQGAWVDVRLY
jgi:molybdopterin molybdotransferase